MFQKHVVAKGSKLLQTKLVSATLATPTSPRDALSTQFLLNLKHALVGLKPSVDPPDTLICSGSVSR